METSGWIFLLTSCALVVALNIYCFSKVFTLPPDIEEDLHGPLDIDTKDREE